MKKLKKEQPAPKPFDRVTLEQARLCGDLETLDARLGMKGLKHKPVQREAADQAAVVAWARGSCGKYPEFRLIYAIPNGRAVHIVTRLKMIREGGLSGVPDLCLPVARWTNKMTFSHALYIDMKALGKKAEAHQKVIHALLEGEGNLVCVCDTPESAIKLLEWYVRLPKEKP